LNAYLLTFPKTEVVECYLFAQVMMLTSQHGSSEEHTFSSDPVNWPFMEQNIIYWIDFQTNVSDLPIAYALFFTIYEK